MSDSGIGFGGFLLGLGAGWYIFKYYNLGFDVFSYLLILMGIGIILSSLLNRGRRKHPISGIFGGIIGGLFLAAIITQGFGIFFNFIDVSPFSDEYRATETFSDNIPVTLDVMDLSINSVNGGIDVSSWDGDSVKFEIEVRARGGTTAEAERRIDDFDYDLSSSVSGGVQMISLSFPLSNSEWNQYSVNIEAYVPTGVVSDYDLSTTNGAVYLDDALAEFVIIETTNGAITLSDVEADHIEAATTNGAIYGTITTQQSNLETTNGAIELTITKTSGTHILSTTNGAIDINVSSDSDVGYKVDFDVSIGSVDVNLPNMDYTVDRTRTKIGEISGYDSKTVKIEITAETTTGSIELN